MKFLKHLFPGSQKKTHSDASTSTVIINRAHSSVASAPRSFGEKRAQQMNTALQKAMTQRKELVKKQFASPDPLSTVFKHKGHRLDGKIRSLQDQKK